MQSETISKLVSINKNFYENVAPIWNDNPDYFWDGWFKLVPYLNDLESLRVLDLGCGGGRFARFLSDHLSNRKIEYLGLDFDSWYIKKARQDLANLHNLQATLQLTDLSQDDWLSFTNVSYDCAVVFGLFHHMPGKSARENLIKKIHERLRAGRLFIFTLWNFIEEPRLKKRIVDPSLAPGEKIFAELNLNPAEFEPGDYILDWVKKVTTYRYAHNFDQIELNSWIDIGFTELSSYKSDGRMSLRNKYYIWQKNS